MQTYIVLLRGINVSGKKKIRMADLKTALEKAGFQDVSTYIQSGNIILRHNSSKEAVNERVKACLQNDFGYDVPVLSFTPGEWDRIYATSPYPDIEATQKNRYFVFLFETPAEERITALEQESFPNEDFHISPNCIYLNCLQGYGKAKCNNNFFEQRLKLRATTRNLRTVRTLAQMAARMD